MGCWLAFDINKSDFSLISNNPLAISNIIQKAFINIDEEGTEAAAVTTVNFINYFKNEKIEPVEFICDRPFIFIIHTNDFGILFIGKYIKAIGSS
jgi:serine protease inhibitor